MVTSYTVKVNENVQIRCLVIGYPKPRVEWVPDLKGATTLPGDPSILVFSKAQLSQSGDYRCLTTNEIVDPNGIYTASDIVSIKVTVEGMLLYFKALL